MVEDNPMVTHEQLVKSLCKDGQEMIDGLDPQKMHMIHMVMGICGEAGELLDAVKKHVIYGKQLDIENVNEELGDTEFYLEGFRQAVCCCREDTIQRNIQKLLKRYPGMKYTNQAAINRADKNATAY